MSRFKRVRREVNGENWRGGTGRALQGVGESDEEDDVIESAIMEAGPRGDYDYELHIARPKTESRSKRVSQRKM